MKHPVHQKDLLFGIGLRKPHWDQVLNHKEEIDFLEVVSDNYMGSSGKEWHVLEHIHQEFNIILHGVGLSIGSPDRLNEDYLYHLKKLIEKIKPPFFSDHICYSSAFGVEYHDLIPLPFTMESVKHLAPRIQRVKQLADIPFLLENPSYYIRMPGSSMSELDFILEVLDKGDCGLLLDVNNVYVNATNHGYDPRAFIAAIPPERVYQYHMAGHYNRGDVIIDTHGAAAIDPVIDLYQFTLSTIGPRPTLFEWDNQIPPLSVLLQENNKIRQAALAVLGNVQGTR